MASSTSDMALVMAGSFYSRSHSSWTNGGPLMHRANLVFSWMVLSMVWTFPTPALKKVGSLGAPRVR